MACKIQTCNDDVIEYLNDVTELDALIHMQTLSVAKVRRMWIQRVRSNLDRPLQITVTNAVQMCGLMGVMCIGWGGGTA
jgi:hypothetical protein